MQTLQMILKQFFPSVRLNVQQESDLYICSLLENVKTVDEWNTLISEIQNIQLRATIEQNGIIHQILKT